MKRSQHLRTKTAMHRQLLLWVCGIVTVALTMSRHWVICRHDGGDAHLEINHAAGDHQGHSHVATCDCGHAHGHDHKGHDHKGHDHDGHPHGGHPHDGGDCDPHDSCSHTDLLVEVGPEQEPDSVHVPKLLAFELPNCSATQRLWTSTKKHVLAPPATGPPRPRRFWSLRRTTLLLI